MILFIVTSAINNDIVRHAETVATIESIHKTVPSAMIWLIESSQDRQFIQYPRVKVIDYSADPFIHEVHAKNREIGYVKNTIEMYTTLQTLKDIPNRYSKIFKLSGRYLLTEDFRLMHPANKATFAQARKTGFSMEQVGTDGMLMTRLYSFCYTVIPQMIATLEQMREFHEQQWNAGKVFDMEHGFYKFLPRDILHEVGKIGVRGRIGHLSYTVED